MKALQKWLSLFGLGAALTPHYMVDPNAGSGALHDQTPVGERRQELLQKGKNIVKQAAEFALIALGVAALGGILGYSVKKGANLAERRPGMGAANDEDNTMSTAQAGARGGRQRAA